MKYVKFLCTSFVVLVLGFSSPQSAQAQEAVLESYTIGHGGNQGFPQGLAASLTDRAFGNGTARAWIQFEERANSSKLSLIVGRWVRRDEIVPALLVFRVEVRGFDILGMPVYARDLGDFSFGDSRPGLWLKQLGDLPAGIAQLSVTFFGNYE